MRWPITTGLICSFVVWILPWILSIGIAASRGAIAPEAPMVEGAPVAITLQFVLTLIILLLFIRLFGIRLLSYGSIITIGLGLLVLLNLVVGIHSVLAVALTIVLVFLAQASRSLLIHNAVILGGLLGLGLLVGGSLKPTTFLILLVVLAVYDLIAVFSGFIPNLVKSMKKGGMPIFVLLQIPEKLSEWVRPTAKTHVRVIGTGDIFAPMLLMTSLAAVGQVSAAWWVFGGAVVGVVADLYIITHYRQKLGIPALPTIVVGIIIAYFIVKVV